MEFELKIDEFSTFLGSNSVEKNQNRQKSILEPAYAYCKKKSQFGTKKNESAALRKKKVKF